MRTRIDISATCSACYAQHRTVITPEFIERNFFSPLEGALETAESAFLAGLVETDGWRIDDDTMLCRLCARKADKEQEQEDAE